jgi:hypothetical protein
MRSGHSRRAGVAGQQAGRQAGGRAGRQAGTADAAGTAGVRVIAMQLLGWRPTLFDIPGQLAANDESEPPLQLIPGWASPHPSPCAPARWPCPHCPCPPALPARCRDRRGGRDHIWLTTHDEGSCWVPAAIRPSIILSHWGRKDANHTTGTGYWEGGAARRGCASGCLLAPAGAALHATHVH